MPCWAGREHGDEQAYAGVGLEDLPADGTAVWAIYAPRAEGSGRLEELSVVTPVLDGIDIALAEWSDGLRADVDVGCQDCHWSHRVDDEALKNGADRQWPGHGVGPQPTSHTEPSDAFTRQGRRPMYATALRLAPRWHQPTARRRAGC